MENTFKKLQLDNNILQAINDMGFSQPSKIQQEAIPIILNNEDIIGLSETGSGKTAAFSIPALQLMDTNSIVPQFLVVAPTRELAMQIAEEIKALSKYLKGVFVTTLFGQSPMHRQIRDLKKANVVVGTPGRILDHLKRRTLILNHLKLVVLDEADEMLNMGFYQDITNILDKCPKDIQKAFFSATMDKDIKALSQKFLNKPKTITIKSKSVTPKNIQQSYYYLKNKESALITLINYIQPNKAIIFTNTKVMADKLSSLLQSKSINANALHGDLPQNVRTNILKSFRDNQLKFLIATDVAARGIDVDDIDLVINYDLPQSDEYYIHRIGRTARAGKTGSSITLINTKKQLRIIKKLEKLVNSEIVEETLPTYQQMSQQIVKTYQGKILSSSNQEIDPLAKELIDRIKQSVNNQLSNYEISLLLANTLVKDSLQANEVENENDRILDTEVVVSLGRKHNLRPRNLAKSIASNLNISNKAVGDIKLYKNYSTVMLNKNNAKRLVNLKSLNVAKDIADFNYSLNDI